MVLIWCKVFFNPTRNSYTSNGFLFSGGFYSDTLGYVAESCRKCPNGSYVAFDKKPGKSVLDCRACPLGKTLSRTHSFSHF